MGKLKKVLRVFVIALVLVFLSYLVGRTYDYFTAGFSLGNIILNHPDEKSWEVEPLSPEESKQVDEILNQHFTYLSKGHQAYVFISDDGKYVLKFLKTHVMRIKPWVGWLPDYFGTYKNKKIAAKERRLDGVFLGWKIAYEHLRDKTDILFVKMNKNPPIHKVVHITDKIGRNYTVDLDQTAFLIQKKVDVFSDVFEKLIKDHQTAEAKKLLDSMINLYSTEYHEGYWEFDPQLMRNTGFDHGKAMHIDTGRFAALPANPQPLSVMLKEKTPKLVAWLQERDPELAAYFIDQMNNADGAHVKAQ